MGTSPPKLWSWGTLSLLSELLFWPQHVVSFIFFVFVSFLEFKKIEKRLNKNSSHCSELMIVNVLLRLFLIEMLKIKLQYPFASTLILFLTLEGTTSKNVMYIFVV
jgi:hypothetical protein